jgi:DNA-binding NtrC family response regulator
VNSIVDQGTIVYGLDEFGGPEGAILVIEDCEPVLFFLNSALLSLGYPDQHLAANLAEANAVWALHKGEIRHVILNYELPDGICLEFAQRISQERPDINIIVTTGYEISSIRETCEGATPLRFLQKPFRLAELKSALTRASVVQSVE